jgi:hypothetical protein
MNPSAITTVARITVWLVVVAAALAVWSGQHWAWIAAAIAVALAADARDALLRARRGRIGRNWS